MKRNRKIHLNLQLAFFEGFLLSFSPVPLLFYCLPGSLIMPDVFRLILAVLACGFLGITAFLLSGFLKTGKTLGVLALIAAFISGLPYFISNPFAFLLVSVLLTGIGNELLELSPVNGKKNQHFSYYNQRVRTAAVTSLVFLFAGHFLPQTENILIDLSYAFSAVSAPIIAVLNIGRKNHFGIVIIKKWQCFFFLLFPFLFLLTPYSRIWVAVSGLYFVFRFRNRKNKGLKNFWWQDLLEHPAKVLVSTFFLLCLSGTFLLLLPVAAKNGAISTIDAVFTSVSAVCVTGLIVLDTPHDFSFYGQFFILLLIQLGGLGIMTITTMALHAMGRRISLRQERLLITMTDTSHKELLGSLRTILYFTFTAEFVGAFILTVLFYSGGESFQSALWRGVFTSISAFCNAGFALQSDSLIPYQTNPLLLHTVGLLIILGGIAPAISLIIPKWLLRRPVPLAAEISLNMTAVLLVAGTIFMLIFEWNGFLSGLSLPDKIHNAWFQSLTLRTAGFNSVDISTLAAPSFLIMICFMFIGGSPGGTAGGVKTTTVAVLVMTFWANITGRQEVVFRRRRLPAAVISRAVTIISSGFIVWFLVVLMLEVTQQGVARDIIFEVTSALGTVGLSTGATAGLDEIGKIIIIFTMFIGRIGPMTLFMFLSDWRPEEGNCQYPEAKITLT